MKLATAIGVSLSNSLQVIVPIVVSMVAVGPVGSGTEVNRGAGDTRRPASPGIGSAAGGSG